jgi:hypothetical protein
VTSRPAPRPKWFSRVGTLQNDHFTEADAKRKLGL